MFVRNLLQSGKEIELKAGEYVTVVPFSLPITLQYDDKGLIQKVYVNHEMTECHDMTAQFLPLILKNKQVPNKISIAGNTSYIRGAFVTEDITASLKKHPESLEAELIQMYVADPTSFKFYAGDVNSKGVTFKGAVATRQWLSSARFTLLPGYVVPQGITEDKFRSMVAQNYPFTYPLISSYIVYHSDYSISYPKIQLSQDVATSIETTYNEIGDIISNISYADSTSQQVPYSTVVKFNILPESLVIRNSEHAIIHSIAPKAAKKSDRLSNKLQCSCCGRMIVVPSTGNVRCSDPQCNSVLYPRVLQLCKCLDAPMMSFDAYKKLTSQLGSIFSILDVLDSDKYKDLQFDVTLAQGLRAVVPKTILPNMRQINQICDNCSNSLQTFEYYIHHPDKLQVDFDLDIHVFSKFFTWIQDSDNVSDIIEFFKLPNVHIVQQVKKFDGAPIFRDKLIMLTGSFIRGSVDDISSILRSYAAEVTTELSDAVNCVIIGDTQENVDGHAVIDARRRRVPIMTESEFFTQYDIDNDLAQNL